MEVSYCSLGSTPPFLPFFLLSFSASFISEVHANSEETDRHMRNTWLCGCTRCAQMSVDKRGRGGKQKSRCGATAALRVVCLSLKAEKKKKGRREGGEERYPMNRKRERERGTLGDLNQL